MAGTCTFSGSKVVAKVSSSAPITNTVTCIVNAVNAYGALAASVIANPAFFNYKHT